MFTKWRDGARPLRQLPRSAQLHDARHGPIRAVRMHVHGELVRPPRRPLSREPRAPRAPGCSSAHRIGPDSSEVQARQQASQRVVVVVDDAEMGKTPTQLENTRPNQTDNSETRGGTIER